MLPIKEDNVVIKVENEVLYDRVLEIIERVLNEREKFIICNRYGINVDKSFTQLEIAEKLNISRSYVSRIEKKAIAKIAKEMGGA